MRLLLDHNLSPRIARALDALFSDEHEIVALRERFSPSATDVEWITSLDRDGGWAVLTKDLRIRTRPHERLALDRARIVFFFLDGAWRTFGVAETTARLIRLVPKMTAQVDLTERGRFDLRSTRARSCGYSGIEEDPLKFVPFPPGSESFLAQLQYQLRCYSRAHDLTFQRLRIGLERVYTDGPKPPHITAPICQGTNSASP